MEINRKAYKDLNPKKNTTVKPLVIKAQVKPTYIDFLRWLVHRKESLQRKDCQKKKTLVEGWTREREGLGTHMGRSGGKAQHSILNSCLAPRSEQV
jgi:hypothetical protein